MYEQNRILGKRNTLWKQYERKLEMLLFIISKWNIHKVASTALVTSNQEHDINAVIMAIILLVELMTAIGIVVVHKRRYSRNR